MSSITVIWSMSAGAGLMLALTHAVVWLNDRKGRGANLVFAVMAVAVAALGLLELASMRAKTPEQFGTAVRWMHVPAWLIIVCLVGFVRLYLRAGRRWLAWTIVSVRTLSLILNFTFSPNLNYRQVSGLRHVWFLGESLSLARAVPSPWMLIAQLGLLLLAIFVADATITVWRRGDKRQAIVGGSIVLFVLLGGADAAVIAWGIASIPVTMSLFFQCVVAAMALELGYDLFAAAQVVQQLQLSDAALRESEARFRIVADATPVLIWMSGMDKLCNFFNKSWLEFTGRTIEQEMGNGWAEGVHPDDLQRCLKTYAEAFDAREGFVMEYRLRRHDGQYRWISDTGVPRYNAEKNFSGYIGSCVDITESISNQQALRESEERMSLAIEAAKLGLWEWNVSKDELWGSEARRALLGLPTGGTITLEEGLSRVHVDDRDRVRKTLQESASTGKDYHLEYRVVLADGSVRWTEHRGARVGGTDGKPVLLRGISLDVTERKRAEEEFRLTVEASPSGIILADQTGKIVLVNAHVEELFGYGREELMGRPVEILVPDRVAHHHPEHRARFFAAPTARPMGAGRELFGRRKDGSEFPVEIGLNPIETSKGVLILAAVVDISARKRAEEEAQLRRDQINRLTRVSLLGEMAGSIAHEVSQPLGAMTANASAMINFIDRGRVDGDKFREILSSVVRDGRRARDVISNIRDTIKKGSVARKKVALNDIVRNVMHMVQPDAAALSCELRASLAEHLPTIDADPIQIQQVLINLVGNAFDAMRDISPGERKVEIATELDNEAVRVSVRDHGTGITETSRERLFEQFYSTKEDGLGMGLAIVRSIIQAHAGTISAENPEGGGARFVFALPVSNGSFE